MSTLSVSNISDGTTSVGTSYVVNGSAKAWLTFYQTVPSIGDSFNTSSVTDQATGNYYQNFTNSFANADYSSQGSSDEANSNATFQVLGCDFSTRTSSQNRWWTILNTTGSFDGKSSSSVQGDLA